MRRLLVLLATALVALQGAAGAGAHGDPTIHYLETELLLSSYASPPAQALELQLLGLLQASDRRGYPIKVSLIANESDTLDDPAPLRSPQRYAERVAATLHLRTPVVIVTPNGLGVAGEDTVPAAVAGVELPREAQGDDLARAAMVAVRGLARAAGRPLPERVAAAQAIGPQLVGRAQREDSSGRWLLAVVLASVPLVAGLAFVARKLPKHTSLSD